MLSLRILITLALASCAVAWGIPALVAGSASAGGLLPPVVDCEEHAQLTHHYTIGQLQAALHSIPADAAEYGDCHDVLQRQLLVQLGGLSGEHGSGASGGSFLPVWLIVVLALLAVGAGGFGVLAVRNRRAEAG